MLSWEACRGVLLHLRPTDAHLQVQRTILTSDDHGSTGLTTRRVIQVTSLPLQRIELCSGSQLHKCSQSIANVLGHPFTYQHGPTWVRSDILRHLATSCIFGMPLRAKLRLCLNTILTPTASIADVLSVFKRYHTVRCFKSFRGLRLRKMELAFTGLNPVTKEVQREDQRYSHTCTYTASKPLHCESCTYTWQSQAVNLDKHVLLHLGVCLGLSQQSNRGNMQQTFFAILLLLARSKNVPSNRSNKPMDQHHKSWEMCLCPSYRGHSGHRTCRITFCVDFWPRIRVATLTMHPNAIQALSWTRPPDGRRRHAKSTLS